MTSGCNILYFMPMELKSLIEQSMARRFMDDNNSNDVCLFKGLLFEFFSGFDFECDDLR